MPDLPAYCVNCKHWWLGTAGMSGLCKRHAPVANFRRPDTPVWPVVSYSESCGDHDFATNADQVQRRSELTSREAAVKIEEGGK